MLGLKHIMLFCVSAEWVVDLIDFTWIIFLLDHPTHAQPIYYVWLHIESSQHMTNSVQHHRSQALAWIWGSSLPISKWLVVMILGINEWYMHSFYHTCQHVLPTTRCHSTFHLPMWLIRRSNEIYALFTLNISIEIRHALIHVILMLLF